MSEGTPDNAPVQNDSSVQESPAVQETAKRISVPTPEQIAQEDFMNNCIVRSVMSGVMGGGLGVVFGIFSASMEGGSGSMAPMPNEDTRKAREVFRDMVKSARSKSVSYAKAFGGIGLLFAGSECVIETYRAKHDAYNSAYAGCFSGGFLARSGGPKVMCFGCASFAAFSVMIDRFLDH
ncbi:hypothetical protein BSKO_08967 [Bryopsis sp. KO-2023]|nr:hypothetical protein BSKO_08967 [Bryopsis sp. KO-2023]